MLRFPLTMRSRTLSNDRHPAGRHTVIDGMMEVFGDRISKISQIGRRGTGCRSRRPVPVFEFSVLRTTSRRGKDIRFVRFTPLRASTVTSSCISRFRVITSRQRFVPRDPRHAHTRIHRFYVRSRFS